MRMALLSLALLPLVLPAPGCLDARCQNSEGCKERGLCTGQFERCVVGSHEDCAQSKLCADEGRCRSSRVGSAMQCVR